MRMKIKKEQKDTPLKANYRKLWLKEHVDKEFMLQTLKIHKNFNLPITNIPPDKAIFFFFNQLKKEDTEYVRRSGKKLNIISKQAKKEGFTKDEHLNLVNSLIKNLPSINFFSSVELFAKNTGFSKKWVPCLILYLITDKILPPTDKADSDSPPPEVIEDYAIFIKRIKANVQRETKAKNATTYLKIGQEVFGDNTDRLTDKQLSIYDKKLINLTKKRYQRFNEKYGQNK